MATRHDWLESSNLAMSPNHPPRVRGRDWLLNAMMLVLVIIFAVSVGMLIASGAMRASLERPSGEALPVP